jgi:hypothetical protein
MVAPHSVILSFVEGSVPLPLTEAELILRQAQDDKREKRQLNRKTGRSVVAVDLRATDFFQ